MSVYSDELEAADRRAREAYEAMEAWLSRPVDAPDVPGALLEGYAKTLRDSREQVRQLLEKHGARDDIAAALDRSEAYHKALGLTIRDKPKEPENDT